MRDAIVSFLGDDWTRVMEQMEEALSSDIGLLDSTNKNILRHSGKLLRPMLALLSARACSGFTTVDSCRLAAAVEILHNATLLHDDVADSSMERRGMPTLNASLGPGAAVLVGDFWLARALNKVLGSDHCNKVLMLFAKTLGELAEGEMLQLEKASSADTDEKDYFRIITCKTASLFECACVSAAISVDAPNEYIEAIRQYALAAGMAFQIKDDILDYVGDEKLGKPVGTDLKERKITLPLLGALHDSSDESRIRSIVAGLDSHPSDCESVRQFVIDSGGLDYAVEKLEEQIARAEKSLQVLPEGQPRDYLVELVRFNSIRKV